MNAFLAIFLGGGLGSVCRFLTAKFFFEFVTTSFPLGTLVVNTLGSFLIGIICFILAKKGLTHGAWYTFIVIGFLGGYTTFSTFSFETILLLKDLQYGFALFNVVSSVTFSLLAVWIGLSLAKFFWLKNSVNSLVLSVPPLYNVWIIKIIGEQYG